MSSNGTARLTKTTLPKWLKVTPAASSASSKLLHATSFSDPGSVSAGPETAAFEEHSQLNGSSAAPVAFQSSLDEERSTRNRACDYSRALVMDTYRSLVTGSHPSAGRSEADGESLQEEFRARHNRRTPAYQETYDRVVEFSLEDFDSSTTSAATATTTTTTTDTIEHPLFRNGSLNSVGSKSSRGSLSAHAQRSGEAPLIRSNSLNSTGSRGAKRRLDTMQEEDAASAASSVATSTTASTTRPQHEKNPAPPTLPSIPTAIVRLGGADLEDRSELAEGIVREFEKVKFRDDNPSPNSPIPILCVIRGREKSSSVGSRGQLSLKSVMNNILKHCVEGSATLSPALKQLWSTFKVNPSSPLWFDGLQSWYAKVLHDKNIRPVQIVVTFTAFEALPDRLASDVLCALSSLASSNTLKMPISIVIVLSTATVPAFPLVLSPAATVSLKVKTFRAPKLCRLLDTMVEQLICHPVESLPVILSGPVLGLLKEVYTDLSMSLIGFVRNLLVALDCHFTKTGSYLCVLHREEYTRGYSQLCARTLDHIRHQDEFQDFLRVDRLPKIAELKNYLQSSLEKRLTFQSAFACLIRAAKMGGFGRLLQDGSKLRVVALYENMERRTDEFRRYLNDLCNSLKVLRLRELIPLLIDFMDILRGYQDAAKRACSSSTASVFGIDGVYANLAKNFEEVGEFIILCGAAEKMEGNEQKTKELIDVLFRDITNWFGHFIDRASEGWTRSSAEAEAKGNGNGNWNRNGNGRNSKNSSSRNNGKSNGKGWGSNAGEREDKTKDCDRLHDLISYSNVKQLKRSILGEPRRAVTTALSKPQVFIKCDCCSLKGYEVCSTMEDTCVAYKLFVASGKTLGGKEWLGKFEDVMGDDNDDGPAGKKDDKTSGSKTKYNKKGAKSAAKKSNGNKKKVSKGVGERFHVSVNELILLGLVKKLSGRSKGKYERCSLVWCR
ncbi:hypothetical protein TrVE_jg155 [Triparma verrucosa]|uniref:Origin recognition complex subunit 3 winged helix C-terminal domain-containing protein n=1 Tax=Triparma verrucosa TaxID=1606542 RepID=A0A9W7F7P3_9STRA|nr:hypothetical protein TrVE_jg155 [Triparma verrucosa]